MQSKTEKMYTLEEVKHAFFETFHKAGKVTFPGVETAPENHNMHEAEEYCLRVTNSRWELMNDKLVKPGKSSLKIPDLSKPMIFIFGSNEIGAHGAGAALHARRYKGAVLGQGWGLQGQSFAIPTKDRYIRTLPLEKIKEYVDKFLVFAKEHPELYFEVTRIGCGLAGYKDSDIAPMFKDAPENCILSEEWRAFLLNNTSQSP